MPPIPPSASRAAPTYRAFGFIQTARPALTLDDGVQVEGVAMQRAIT